MKTSIRLIISITIFSLLTACDAIPTLSDPSADNANDIVPVARGLSPQETVETFLNAWADEDFNSMYALLHPRSTEVYPLESFREQYESAHNDIGFADVSYTIGDVTIQGMSAAITYDVLLITETFGDIPDENRTIRLVEENGSWRLAWSPMDIINGMTANVSLDPNRSFPARGNIYDTNGQLLVNENGTSYGLVMRLSDMRGEDECTELLSRIMLRPISYFTSLYVGYRSADSAFFVGEISEEIHDIYRNDLDNICGTDIEVEFVGAKIQERTGRSYFGHGAAAHITGYMSYVPADNAAYWIDRGYSVNDTVGLTGVEFAYQDELAGLPDQSLRLIDSSGVILRSLGSADGADPSSITLTIDRDLQWDTAQTFIDAWNYGGPDFASVANGGAAVVMDVNTGAVLSMFSFPTYDPRIFVLDSAYYSTNTTDANASAQITYANSFGQFLPAGPATINRAYSEQYAPGSVFKILSTLAAADSGIWERDAIFDCDLTWDGSSRGDTAGLREDWRVVEGRDAAGPITMATALTTSCNPFFWEVGALMYQEDSNLLYDYATRWGFGQRTQLLGLPETEATGVIPQPTNVTTAINDVIGQGDTSVTALQMVRLVAAVANGGTLYQPYLIQQIGSGEDAQAINPTVVGQLGVSDMALEVTREGMCEVPINTEYGTSTFVFGDNSIRPSYTSCGKTGTAQTLDAPNSWYVAYAPADNPQIAIAVVVPNSREGSEVAAPIVRRILDNYFDGAVAEFPDWWQTPYVPVQAPQGVQAEG
ncbi:MAG: hypothetical protein Phog2KO_23890 [Phototrophicaceae bacterium]